MAPGGKRKRPERSDSNDAGRPSPHRPQNLGLANAQQQQQQQSSNARGGRRGSRNTGRGGPNSSPNSPVVTQPSPSAMSPPAAIPPSSRPAPPAAPSTPTPLANSNPPPMRTDPSKASKTNQYLTQDRAGAWGTEGRNAVVQAGTKALAESDMLTLSLVFEELVQGCLDQVLNAEELGTTVRDILAASSTDMFDPISVFLDTVSTVVPEATTEHRILRPMLEATNIDTARMRSELENGLLFEVGLVRTSFAKMAIRKATHALYRQSNYNLLREETEGFAKLITEYFTIVHSEPPSADVVSDTFQRVKALIGAFDLDVGRVLDVSLDVFANLLVKHNRFFVKFLRVSSWWPEQKVTHGIAWQEPMVSTLPQWASPGFSKWHYTDEGRDEQLLLREQRDIDFWQRVDKLGITAYFELGARRITTPDIKAAIEATKPKKDDELEKKPVEPSDFEKIQTWSEDWMLETGTLPPSGNRIAAQLLGFKLRFYASDTRDAHDILPDNLIYLAALLIKIGFISLADLYPHIYPLDEDMPAHREKLMKAKKEKEDKAGGIQNNALAMAGALPDDTLPAPGPVSRLRESESKGSSKPESERGTPPRNTEDPKDKLPEPVDQKVALLRSLLCIGALPEALFILGRFPWLLEVYPDLHTYMFRVAHHSLSKVYDWARPFPPQTATPKQGPPNGVGTQATTRPSDYIPRRTLRWAKLEEKDAGDGIDYRFYWDDWADNVPICQDVDDVFRLCKSWLKFIGLECGKDAVLMTKLARIGKKSMAEDSSPKNLQRWTTLSATFLGPALSFSGRNPGVVNEVWDLFKNFDTATRYMIYTTWFNGNTKRQTAIIRKYAEVTSETKRLFNRINTENTRLMGRAIAKPAYACPGVVFGRALQTAEQYSNMTEPLVECCRYLTYLGYDCLNWTFINSFKEERPAVQGDGMVTKPWLKNAAFFIGKAYRRYSLMDPTPILQFVADQLLKGKLFMLEILEQLITTMAGIGPVLALTESQVHGLSAGPLLKAFTLEHYLGDKRHQGKTTARRLLKCLKEAGLTAQVLVALARELELYVFRDEFEDAPLKVVGANLDNLHSNFAQYLDFLRTYLTIEEFDAIIPGLVELMSVFGLGPGIAFTITRASLSIHINAARAERKARKTESISPAKLEASTSDPARANGDISMGDMEDTSLVNGTAHGGEAKKEPTSTEDTEMKDIPSTDGTEEKDTPDDGPVPTVTQPRDSSAALQGHSNTEIEALAHQLQTAMPKTYGDHICLNFFVTFWQLSLVDVFTVTSMKEMKEYTAASKFYAEKATRVPYDRRDVSAQAVEKRRSEIQGYNDQSAAFRNEAKETLEAALKLRTHLQDEMHKWFEGIPMMDARSEELHDVLLQDCFLPRILLSSQDAQFAAAMLKFMHEIGVPGFRTMKFLDQFFKHNMLTGIIFMCSSREAQNLGRFLNDILKELNLWHSSQANYTKFAHGQKKSLPGFGKKFNPDRTPAMFLDYEDFKRVLYKWHSQLFKAFEACFKSDEYMHIRNAINVLKAVATSFPKVDFMGKSLHSIVQQVSQHDTRDDLKLAALSLLGDLKKTEKTWLAPTAFNVVSPHIFQAITAASAKLRKNRPASASTTTPAATGRTNSDAARTPQPPESQTKLKATAPDFKPGAANTNGTSTPSTTQTGRTNGETTPTATAGADRGKDRESNLSTPAPAESGDAELLHRGNGDHLQEDMSTAITPARPSAPSAARPEGRNAPGQASQSSRVPHDLPPRPEPQPHRNRPLDRTSDRQAEYNTPPGRNDSRNNGPHEYGRLDRGGAPPRDSLVDRRDMSPGRRAGGRTPERRDAGWGSRDPRDIRDPREYHDERPMRPPPREARPPPQPYGSRDPRDTRDIRDPRDPRDSRDARDRPDHRGPPQQPPIDGRSRLHSNPPMHQGGDRSNNLPPRQPIDRSSTNTPSTTADRPTPDERSMINPARAARMDDRGRHDPSRPDRDTRLERGSRPQSPRRGNERVPVPYQGRGEPPRDHRDDRPNERTMHDRTPDHSFPANRDRRDELTGPAPTGPRGGRNEPPASARLSREMFAPSRPASHQAQDPNYGRLNPPAEPVPSGPRGTRNTVPPSATAANPLPTGPASNRRDSSRRESMEQSHPPAPPPVPTAPAAAQPNRPVSGIHPSRLQHINAPPIQTDVGNAPSGPRGAVRTPTGPASSPSSRGPPTGPASGPRNQGRTALGAINNVLNQSQNYGEGNTAPPIRGRGANRASNLAEPPTAPSPGGSSSHPGTPNAPRPEPSSRSERADNRPPDDGRHESRSHRESRHSRSGRQRSRSPGRDDRRVDERGTRNGPTDRPPRNEETERNNDRERREKRGGERDSGRREREREGEHSTRDGRERRERSGRDEGRGPGRGEEPGSRRGAPPVGGEQPQWPGDGRDPRSGRGGGERRDDRGDRRRDEQPRDSRGDGRKRGPVEEPPAHRDPKRSRRSQP